MTFSVKLTRNEYMEFCAKSRPKVLWPTALGMMFVLGAIAVYVMEGYMMPLNWLLLFGGLCAVTAQPLWLPLREKGAAGRRFDASDALSRAMMITIDDTAVTVKTACVEGSVPLSLMTEKKKTADMACLCFGEELCVYIPRRAVSADEWMRICEL